PSACRRACRSPAANRTEGSCTSSVTPVWCGAGAAPLTGYVGAAGPDRTPVTDYLPAEFVGAVRVDPLHGALVLDRRVRTHGVDDRGRSADAAVPGVRRAHRVLL